MNKIYDVKHIPGVSKTTGDTLKDRKRKLKSQRGKNTDLLEEFKDAWTDFSDIRYNRARNYRYVYEDQWSDMVKNDDDEWVTERERISKRTGGVVLQNNHLITIPTTLTGLYTKSATMPTVYARTPNCDDKADMMSNALQANWKRTGERELMTDRFLDLAVGGIAAVVEEWSVHEGVEDSYTFPVNVDYMAWKSKGNDPRGWDIYLIGEIRDQPLSDLASELNCSKSEYDQLNALYEPMRGDFDENVHRSDTYETMDFERPNNSQLCRTYRIWTYESKQRIRCIDKEDRENPLYKVELSDRQKIVQINAERAAINAERAAMAQAQGIPEGNVVLLDMIEMKEIWDHFWHFWLLAPDGTVLDDYDSPYDHNSHPYTIRAHNYVRGKVVPFVSPVIDQQRYINRLITLYDLAVSSSINGLKMIPKSIVPRHMSNEQFMKKAIELGGWIFYDDEEGNGAKPEFITQNSIPVGVADLLQMQVSWMKDISNVSGALQGQQPQSGTAFARYALETENSTTSLATLIGKFAYFETDVARKKLKTIHQFYQEPRNISNQHSTYASYAMYDPVAVQDIDFDCNICETADSPTARAALNEFTQMLWDRGAIGLENFVSRINLPGKDGILQDIKANAQMQQQAYQQAQQQGRVNESVQPYFNDQNAQMIQQQSNPRAVNALRDALSAA